MLPLLPVIEDIFHVKRLLEEALVSLIEGFSAGVKVIFDLVLGVVCFVLDCDEWFLALPLHGSAHE